MSILHIGGAIALYFSIKFIFFDDEGGMGILLGGSAFILIFVAELARQYVPD